MFGLLILLAMLVSPLAAQPTPSDMTDFAALESKAAAGPAADKAVAAPTQGIDAMNLLLQGGWVMVPLALVSLLVVMWTLERLVSLRSSRILPSSLLRPLTQMIRKSDVLPVQDAYHLCSKSPSVAANVIATTLVRTGRPMPELEHTASEAIQREVDTASGPVRWLAFLAGVSPLLGLLGTVWGLIRAFHDTTQLDLTANRAEVLATGIYEALVTTLVGLCIAIPAAAMAHYFEGRILKQFRRIEELIALLLPRLEAYENRVRFDPIGRDLVARDIQDTTSMRRPSEVRSDENLNRAAAQSDDATASHYDRSAAIPGPTSARRTVTTARGDRTNPRRNA